MTDGPKPMTDQASDAKAAYYQRLQAIAGIANASCPSSVEAGRALQKIADLCSRELRALDGGPRTVEVTLIKTGQGVARGTLPCSA